MPNDPIARFRALLADATAVDRARLPEPTAMSLGTVAANGQPSVRIVLLKDVDDHGFVFYTNLHSRKGREVLAHPPVALCFHWQPLEVQVRVEGTASTVSDAEADAYFASRPRGSRIGAWASLQSQPIEPPGALERRVAEVEARFAGAEVPRPPHWSGFRVAPHRIEFWHAQPSRLHERDLYERAADGGWTVTTLYP